MLLAMERRSARKDNKPIGRQVDRRRRWHIIAAESSITADATSVAGHLWVWKLIVKIAIENFAPPTTSRKPNPIAETVHFLQIRNNKDVLSDAFNPAMDADNSINAVACRDPQRF